MKLTATLALIAALTAGSAFAAETPAKETAKGETPAAVDAASAAKAEPAASAKEHKAHKAHKGDKIHSAKEDKAAGVIEKSAKDQPAAETSAAQ